MSIIKEALIGLVFILGTAVGLTALVAGITYALAALAVATSLWVVGGLMVLALFLALVFIEWWYA